MTLAESSRQTQLPNCLLNPITFDLPKIPKMPSFRGYKMIWGCSAPLGMDHEFLSIFNSTAIIPMGCQHSHSIITAHTVVRYLLTNSTIKMHRVLALNYFQMKLKELSCEHQREEKISVSGVPLHPQSSPITSTLAVTHTHCFKTCFLPGRTSKLEFLVDASIRALFSLGGQCSPLALKLCCCRPCVSFTGENTPVEMVACQEGRDVEQH